MSMLSYPISVIKHGAIGAAVGISYFAAKFKYLERFCNSIPFKDYVCMRSTTLFDIKKYTHIITPPIKLLDKIALVLQLKLPFSDPYLNHSIAYGFAEELLYRLLVQKVAFSAIDTLLSKIPTPQPKKLPSALAAKRVHQETPPGAIDKIRALFSHKVTRILVSTALFTFVHINKGDRYLIHNFLSGLVYGAVFERFGFFTAVIAHAIHNDFTHTYLNMIGDTNR